VPDEKSPAKSMSQASEPEAEHGPRGIGRREFLRWVGVAGGVGAAASLFPACMSDALGQLSDEISTFTPLRPPAVPLAVRSMYLSTWSASSTLPGTWPSFWNGHITALTGIVRVDGTPFVFCGAPAGGFALATQLALTVTATQSIYVLQAGAVTLTVTFLSPVDPNNLQRQCVPMSYITVTVAANDGGNHTVSVYMDISGEWAHGDVAQPISWAQQTVGGMLALTSQPSTPSVLGEHGDQASWGTVVWATDNVVGLSWQTGADTAVRGNAATTGSLSNTNDTAFRAINNNWPVFGLNRSLGSVGPATSAPIVFTIGHVRTPAVSYLGTSFNAWWSNYWATWQDMLTWFRSDLAAATAGAVAMDNQVRAWATTAVGGGTVGDRYAAICALALRQTFGGTELINVNGKPWALLKEISSDGNVATIDVTYPAFPAYLQISPSYLQLLLAPIFDYVENHTYPKQFAPHDLGSSYPNASGHLGGTGEEDMPVEESANMLIMAGALLQRLPAAQATAYAQAHYRLLRQWAQYLTTALPDPGNQNQTDDFTGFIAHSSNLALKGIVGIASMAQIALVAGNAADAASFATTAKNYIATWLTSSQDGQHLRLAYDQPGTWSLKYNGFADRLLNTNLVSPAVQAEEASWYASQAGASGIVLDPRNAYTKGDWEIWTAGFLQAFPAIRNTLITGVYNFANTTANRVPFTDWYVVSTAAQQGFANRPVMGGLFSLQALRNTPNGLLGHWTFDGSTSFDLSGNFQDGVLTGGAAYTAGKQGGAIALNGTTACVSSQRPVVRTDGSFTVTAWANMTNTSGFHTIASQDGDQVSAFFLQFSGQDAKWAFAMTSADVANAATTRAVASAAPATNTWVHLAGVRDAAAGVIKLYVNGVLQQSVAYAGSWQANGAFQIGRAKWNAAAVDFFPGAVDEVRAFDHALSDAEIAASANLPVGVVATYGLEEGTGTTASDAVGGHTLALSGAGWTPGYSGQALAFNGTTGFATTGALLDTSASFSVSAWVYLGAATAFHTAVSQDGTNVSGFFLQYSAQDNAWAFAMLASDAVTAAAARAVAQFAPRVGDWTHLVGVRDVAAGQLRLYVNGRLAGTAASSSAWNATGSFTLGRGRYNAAPADYFPGSIDQVRVWSRALSDAEVLVLV
jgi:hypothetical protein